MAGWTNRGKFTAKSIFFDGAATPANYTARLCTDAVAPTPDTNVITELTEVTGNGYAAVSLSRNSTDFPNRTQAATSYIEMKNLVFTASGGPITARYLVLCDDAATPNIWCYWDFGSNQTVSDGQPMTLSGFRIRAATPAATYQFTNRGKYVFLGTLFEGVAFPTNFYVALVKTTQPTVANDTLGALTEVAAGNGYTSGGEAAARGTGFDTPTEDDTNDLGSVQIANIVWTAAGGDLPSDSVGAEWAVVLDDNVTVGSRQTICWFNLGGARVVSTGQTITLQDFVLRGTES